MGKPNRTKKKIREWNRYLDHCDRVSGTTGHSVSYAWFKLMSREDRQRKHALKMFLERQYRQSSWRATKWD